MMAHANPTTNMPEIVTKTRSIDLGSCACVIAVIQSAIAETVPVHARDPRLSGGHPDDER